MGLGVPARPVVGQRVERRQQQAEAVQPCGEAQVFVGGVARGGGVARRGPCAAHPHERSEALVRGRATAHPTRTRTLTFTLTLSLSLSLSLTLSLPLPLTLTLTWSRRKSRSSGEA